MVSTFWHFNVCDSDKQGRAHKKTWTWQCSNNRLRSNTVGTSLRLCIFTCYCGHLLRLPLFVSVPWSVCLSLRLSEVALWPQLCCWDCGLGGKKESTSRLAQNSHGPFHTLLFFSPAHNCLLWTNGFWLTGLALSFWWMGIISCLRKL